MAGRKDDALFTETHPEQVGRYPLRRRRTGPVTVRHMNRILGEEGYGLSYIHYTGAAPRHRRFGYRTVLKWNRHGVLV